MITPVSELLNIIEEEVARTAVRLAASVDVLQENGMPATGELETRARLVEEEARGLASFVTSLRGLAGEHQRELHLEPTLIQRSIPKLASRLRPTLGERQLFVDLPLDLPPILANESILNVVLRNLIELIQSRSPERQPLCVTGSLQDRAIIVSIRADTWHADRVSGIAVRPDGAPEVRVAHCLLKLMGASLQPRALDDDGMEFRLVLSASLEGNEMVAEAGEASLTTLQMEVPRKDE